MKILSIIFNKTDILKEVSLASAYSGAKAEAPESLFERVATVEEDNELLSRLWTQAGAAILDKFKAFIISSEISDFQISFSMELSSAYDDSLSDSIKSDIFAAFIAAIMALWCKYSWPEKSSGWDVEARDLLARAFSKICHRRRPYRKPLTSKQ